MTEIKKRDIILDMGRTGMGKSIWLRSFLKGRKRIFAFDPLGDLNVNYLSKSELIDLYDNGGLREENCRVGIRDPDNLELLAAISFLSENNWLVIEEASYIFAPGARAPQWLRDPIFLGRHREISILMSAQRPTSMPVDIRSQASRVIAFSQHEMRDILWLEDYFGEDTWEIPGLRPLECLDYENKSVSRYSIDPKNDDRKIYDQNEDKSLSF